jgi:hypothetical protein
MPMSPTAGRARSTCGCGGQHEVIERIGQNMVEITGENDTTLATSSIGRNLLRRLRQHVLAEFRHHLLRQEPHRLALPGLVWAAPVEAGHQ